MNETVNTPLSLDSLGRKLGVAAGFADYANFARRFKARYGLSPTAYRTQKVEKKQKI